MTDIVVRAEHLGKRYVIGHQHDGGQSYGSLRDTLAHAAVDVWRRIKDVAQGHALISGRTREDVWALNDVNFEIARGEAVGIIGRNGAGKSTLLKVLSRITELSTGRVSIRGRVASLLEVGTGFHPELSGRENIYLNGAVLGMSRAEITRKFDEIVAFAELARFLDTPVKRYSSGMYVRLAFAVAAHLEAEILLVDEVLAVGDAIFQKKCLAKMDDVTKTGRTVLFVSHNMGTILQLCSRALLLEAGRVTFAGDVSDAVERYHSAVKEDSSIDLDSFTGHRRGHQEFSRIQSIAILDEDGRHETVFGMGETMVVRLSIDIKRPIRAALFGVLFRNSMGLLIHDFRSSFDGYWPDLEAGTAVFEVKIPEIRAYPGYYTVGAWTQQQVGIASDDYISEALKIQIIDRKRIGDPSANFEIITKEGTEVYHPCSWRRVG
ncbi:MAG TPA: ABC transporter ATP-binding protein [Thermoanaerobaculia bacterium]|nr:ABC transporter ATP-binding protein [Thermoanaerobaculia bacterium]